MMFFRRRRRRNIMKSVVLNPCEPCWRNGYIQAIVYFNTNHHAGDAAGHKTMCSMRHITTHPAMPHVI